VATGLNGAARPAREQGSIRRTAFLLLGLVSVQTGWVETRQVDDSGKRILFVSAIVIGLVIFLAMRARLLDQFWL